MPIQILSTFTRTGVGNYPLMNDTDQNGGFRVVADTTARDAIQTALRKEGMFVWVVSNATCYRLNADLVNWTVVPFGGGGGGIETGTYAYTGSLSVTDVVYLSSANTVARADADDPGKQPVIGFIQAVDNPGAGQCIVQYNGELAGFSGLIAGKTYYIGITPGTITDDVSGYQSGDVVQRVCFARNSSTIVVLVDRDYVVL